MRVGEGIKGVWEEERQERGREGVWVNGKGGVREGCDTVISLHSQGLDLRVEHTHCFSAHGEGGHYHYDITPDDVDYHGYYTVAEQLVRIDRPVHTHSFGRD